MPSTHAPTYRSGGKNKRKMVARCWTRYCTVGDATRCAPPRAPSHARQSLHVKHHVSYQPQTNGNALLLTNGTPLVCMRCGAAPAALAQSNVHVCSGRDAGATTRFCARPQTRTSLAQATRCFTTRDVARSTAVHVAIMCTISPLTRH